jgi:SAM-dependent methyltransferase
MRDHPIIDWPAWIASPPGQYLLAWEQAQLDQVVADIFGFHALQLGMPQLDALRENRMPYRALVLDAASGISAPFTIPAPCSGTAHSLPTHAPEIQTDNSSSDPEQPAAPQQERDILWSDFHELPFKANSVDLLVLPHTLEFTSNPHALLREVARVLVPEGQLIVLGFNSVSLWGARQAMSRIKGASFIPAGHHLIAFNRVKDWLKLLGFELDRGRFGCYCPPLRSEKWLTRYTFMEAAGDRWWPIFGATYMITAIKRVAGPQLVGRVKNSLPALPKALRPAVISRS